MSLKSHYGWRSAQAQADFLCLSGDGEEMRGAKSPTRGRVRRKSLWNSRSTDDQHLRSGVGASKSRRNDGKQAPRATFKRHSWLLEGC